jgi:hypothetical protein
LVNQQRNSSFTEATTPASDGPADGTVIVDAAEFQRLKTELVECKNQLSQDHATDQIKSTFDLAVGQFPDTDNYYKGDVSEQAISQLQDKFNTSTRPFFGRQDGWSLQGEDGPVKQDPKPFGQAVWNNEARPGQYQNGWGMNMNTQNFGPIQVCKCLLLLCYLSLTLFSPALPPDSQSTAAMVT